MKTIEKTDVYLCMLPISRVDDVVDRLSTSGIEMEFLNPEEIGGEWKDLKYLKSSKQKEFESKLKLLDDALSYYQPKGIFAGLIDNRIVAKKKDMDKVKEDQDELLELARNISDYYLLKNRLKESKEKSSKRTVDEDYKALQGEVAEFKDEVGEVVENRNKKQIPAIISRVLEIKEKEKEIEKRKESSILEALQSLRKKLLDQKINPDKIDKKTYSKLATLHAYYEIESLDPKNKVFRTKEDSSTGFAFISVSRSDSAELREQMNKEGLTYESVDWDKDVVIWENKGNLKSFQDVASGVGAKNVKEIDPTVIVSIFYMLFFAFCLGDVLYGAILASFTGYFLFSKKLKRGVKSIFGLLFFSSLATIVFGVLINSWGGNLVNEYFPNINETLKSFSILDLKLGESEGITLDQQKEKYPFLINNILPEGSAIGNPVVLMLLFSGVLGFLHILLGFVLQAINERRNSNISGFFENLFWVSFMISGVVWIAVPDDYKTIAMGLFILSWIGMVVFNSSKSILGKVFGGFGKLYGVISVAADSLSYMRLAATGLSTSIIALVINVLASTIMDGGGIGLIIGLVVLLVGHIFNLVVSAFGAYINPLRLHYVEFMPKFYEGDARILNPETADLKYLKLVSA